MNRSVREALDTLLERFQVIHLCGKGNADSTLVNKPGYCQLEYANTELPDLFAATDLVISRAGANSLYEILALEKPHILVPLPLKSSRGDQIQNARYFEKQGISMVLNEESLNPTTLLAAVDTVVARREEIISKIRALKIESGTSKIIEFVQSYHSRV